MLIWNVRIMASCDEVFRNVSHDCVIARAAGHEEQCWIIEIFEEVRGTAVGAVSLEEINGSAWSLVELF